MKDQPKPRPPGEPCRDDLPFLKASAARRAGVITPFMDSAEIEIGGHKAKVGLWHMFFPNDGSWSFFLCPTCGRRCMTLRLYDGAFRCSKCDGLRLRCQRGDAGPRIERLRAKLKRPHVWRPRETRFALRQALAKQRADRLKGWPPQEPRGGR